MTRLTKQDTSRNFGLDVCRSIAILAVVIGHMLGHSKPHPVFAGMSFVGMFGVDIFFSLSGFLIGRILINESKDWHNAPQTGLLHFWYRRWMRTLPLYYFFLFVWLRWDWKGPTTLAAQIPYLLFAQNLVWPMSDFFLLTWSLAVEEWFYFAFPLIVLTIIGFGGSSKRAVLLTVFAFIVIPFWARGVFAGQIVGLENFDEGVRHIVIFRLDAIGFGVLVAYLYCWHRVWFTRLARLWYFFVMMVIFCAIMPKLGYPLIWGSNFWMSVYLSGSAFAFAGLIPFFSGIKLKRPGVLSRFVQYTSRVSYSLYLGHIIAFIAVIKSLNWLGIFDAVYPNPWAVYPLLLITSYLLATVTYFGIERPVLQMRDKKSAIIALGIKAQQVPSNCK